MNTARDIMTKNPSCCTPSTSLEEVAQMMVECDCGEIPVIRSKEDRTPVGVITDRDITCRTIALGKNPLELRAQDAMSTPCITAPLDASIEECGDLMERHQVRRIPIVDQGGKVVGIIAQADLARREPRQTAEVVKAVSQPGNQTQPRM